MCRGLEEQAFAPTSKAFRKHHISARRMTEADRADRLIGLSTNGRTALAERFSTSPFVTEDSHEMFDADDDSKSRCNENLPVCAALEAWEEFSG